MIDIFDYIDYRSFLKDYYTDQKKNNPKFSYQYFADKAGFKTKTFIPKVISGEKKLAQRSAIMLINAMKLNKKHSSYFEAMVALINTKDFDQKMYYFNQLQKWSGKSKQAVKRRGAFYCYGEWYYKALYELVPIFDWKDDYGILAKAVDPPITSNRAKKAVERLEEFGLIKREESGRYTKTSNVISIDPILMELLDRRYKEQVAELGFDALKNNFKNQETCNITRSVSSGTLEQIKQEIELFKDKIVEMANNSTSKEKVVQLNIHLFPVSKF